MPLKTCHYALPYADRLVVVVRILDVSFPGFRLDVRPDYPGDSLLLSTHSRPELDRLSLSICPPAFRDVAAVVVVLRLGCRLRCVSLLWVSLLRSRTTGEKGRRGEIFGREASMTENI